MNSPLVEVLNEEKTLSNSTTSEYKEEKKNISYAVRSDILKDIIKYGAAVSIFKDPGEDISFAGGSYILYDAAGNKVFEGTSTKKMELEKAFIIFAPLGKDFKFEDETFQTLVKENPIEKSLPKFIPINEAIIRIKSYKEEIKKKLKKRNKEEYAKLKKISLELFDV